MNFFFDENFSIIFVRALRILDDSVHLLHARELFSQGTTDVDWITKLAESKKYFIITSDKKMKKNPAERKALRKAGFTVFVLSSQWQNHEHDEFEPWWRFIRIWKKIKMKATKNPDFKWFEVGINDGKKLFKEYKLK